MLTKPSLEKRLRFLADTTTVLLSPVKNCYGLTRFHRGTPMIVLSPTNPETGEPTTPETRLVTLLHELIHIALPNELAAFGVFEEPIILDVLEKAMMDYICSKPAKLRWWLQRLPS